MNGFGVWHEAFGNKANAWSEYYTTRNTLILQSLYPWLGHSVVKTLVVRLIKAVACNEPKCMAAALKGVEDYVAGPEAFTRRDPEANHITIVRAYGAELPGNMARRDMIKAAIMNAPLFIRCMRMFMKACRLLAGRRDHADWASMTTRTFWDAYFDHPGRTGMDSGDKLCLRR